MPPLLLLLALVACVQAQGTPPRCRLSIPDSGGASLLPNLPPGGLPGTAAVLVPSDTPQSCSGPGGCESLCCAQGGTCLAWGWVVAGSAAALCGGTSCTLFLAEQGLWPATAPQLVLTGGYNVAGFVWGNATAKAACCEAPAPAPAPASPSPAASSGSTPVVLPSPASTPVVLPSPASIPVVLPSPASSAATPQAAATAAACALLAVAWLLTHSV